MNFLKNNFLKSFYVLTLSFVLFAVFLVPVSVASAVGEPSQLVPCKGEIAKDENGGINTDCDYYALIALGQNVMTWAIYLVAIASVISLAWAGWLYISANGNTGQISKAHGIFGKVILGIIITLAAFLIVKSVLGWLGIKKGFSLVN